jgi:outer membrane receptor protein involved in Fe transport
MRRFKVIALVVAVLLVMVSTLSAQQTAQITGTVTDASGAVIPGAQVVIVNDATSIQTTATSDDAGNYRALFLPPGTYSINISRNGFRPMSRTGVALQVAQAVQLNFQLQVGDVAQTVDVVETAPLLDTSASAMGGVVSSEKIANLPMKGRNSNAFMMLEPGVRVPRVTMNQPVLESHFQFFSINGGNPRQNSFLLDGANNNDVGFNGPEYSPQVEGVQEFKVQTNNYSAEYGNVAGGVINVVTKSGTNAYHGTLFEYLRNDIIKANSWFNNRDGIKKAPMRQNQFGGTIGGPIFKNKTFFFVGYEGLRLRLPAGGSTTAAGLPTVITVPTALQRAGDFSQTFTNTGKLVTIYDPATTRPDPSRPGRYIRDPFPGNIIPAGRINPISAAILNYYPLPKNAGDPLTGLNNFPFSGTQPQTNNDISVRVDHQINASTSLMGRFSQSRINITLPFVFPDNNIADPYNSSTDEDHISSVIKLTKTFSPSMFGEFLLSWNRFAYSRYSASSGNFDPTKLGFPGYVSSNASVVGFPQMIIEGMGAGPLSSSIGFYYAENDGYDRPGAKVNFTTLDGRHTLKFGGDVDFPRMNSRKFSNNTGSYTFGKSFTQGPDPLSSGQESGFGFATFLLGTPTAGTYRPTTGDTATIMKYLGLYFQDDIKLTNRLTVNAGIRWDYEGPRTERYNRVADFDFTNTATLPNGTQVRGGMLFPGENGLSRHFWNSQMANFSPRLGFAYSLTDATIIRGGYGLFYGNSSATGPAIPNAPFVCSTPLTASLDGGFTPAASISDPFPNGFCTPSGSTLGLATNLGQAITVYDRYNHKVINSQNWNLDVQQRLPMNLVADIAYSGSAGRHIPANISANQLDPAYLSLGSQLNTLVPNPFYGVITQGPLSGQTITKAQSLLPYPQYANVTVSNATYGSSSYHALYAKLERRFARGFSAIGSYTFSKGIDNVGQGFPGEGFSGGALQNAYDLRGERAVSNFNTPQTLSISLVYELPIGQGKPFLNSGGALNKIIGGWQVNSIMLFQSGAPLQIAGGNPSALNAGTQRPNWSGKNPTLSGSIEDRLGQYFDTSAFSLNAPFTFGNTPRIMPDLYGPGTRNVDLSLFKNTHIGERYQLQFRAEAFNAFNRVQFGNPATNINQSTFGRITTQANFPRDIQLALKLLF